MDDKFIICPFNKSHIIHRLRIQYHIVKCKKNYPSSEKIVCPYNATEYISPDNYISHLCQCKQSKRLDVSEEFKRKQFESIPHGDANPQSFFTPNHVEVTDEWDTQSAQSEDLHNEITPDEEKVMRIKSDHSKALKNAYHYMPLVTQPIGRGKLCEVYREFLNKFEPESKVHSSVFSPFTVSDNDTKTSNNETEDSIYDDADKDENTVEGNFKTFNSSYEPGLNNSKYYRPPVSRGCHKVMSIGRGVPVKRNGISDCEPYHFSSNSLDLILKNLVLNEISVEKGKELSDSSETFVENCVSGELLSDNKKKDISKTLQASGNRSFVSHNVTLKNNKIGSSLENKEEFISPKEIAGKLEDVYDCNDDGNSLSDDSKYYYRPLVSRGRCKYLSLGRGVPLRKYSVSDHDSNNKADYSFNSLDLILEKCISNEMVVDKSKTISKPLESEDSIHFALPDKNHSFQECEQKDAVMNKIISNRENMKECAPDSESPEAVTGISSESSTLNNVTIDSSKNKPVFLPEDVFECSSSKKADVNQESDKKSKQHIEIQSEPFYSIGRGKLLRNY